MTLSFPSVLILILPYLITPTAQNTDSDSKRKPVQKYQYKSTYTTVQIDQDRLDQKEEPRNVILFIGDGMGVGQIFAGMTANRGRLNLEYLKTIGFSKTQSLDKYVTDSGAGGTALSTGIKTYNHAIGVNADSLPVPTLVELAEAKGLATGLVVTSAVTHATPAAFIAHQNNRDSLEQIALDYLETDVDVVIGGGLKNFESRKDGQSLLPILRQKGYTIVTRQDSLLPAGGDKLFALLSFTNMPPAAERKDMLPQAVRITLNRLEKNRKGFFLMVEGSQIDWGGHHNNVCEVVDEVLDLDRAIGVALEFAAKKGETLILCTADHETGGMALEKGNISEGYIRADFTTGNHTGVMVPVFAAGPGASRFSGIYENTEIFNKIKSLLKL